MIKFRRSLPLVAHGRAFIFAAPPFLLVQFLVRFWGRGLLGIGIFLDRPDAMDWIEDPSPSNFFFLLSSDGILFSHQLCRVC